MLHYSRGQGGMNAPASKSIVSMVWPDFKNRMSHTCKGFVSSKNAKIFKLPNAPRPGREFSQDLYESSSAINVALWLGRGAKVVVGGGGLNHQNAKNDFSYPSYFCTLFSTKLRIETAH